MGTAHEGFALSAGLAKIMTCFACRAARIKSYTTVISITRACPFNPAGSTYVECIGEWSIAHHDGGSS